LNFKLQHKSKSIKTSGRSKAKPSITKNYFPQAKNTKSNIRRLRIFVQNRLPSSNRCHNSFSNYCTP